MKQKLLLLCIITLTFNFSSQAQWSLGDIAFSAYGSESATNTPSGPVDAFTIVLLRDVMSGEEIAFTENGWFGLGGFRSNENTITLLFTSNYVAGTQVVIGTDIATDTLEARDEDDAIAGTITGSALSLATGGDQIFAYDPDNVPSSTDETGFIAAIHMNGDWNADATSSTTSAKPSVFTDGVNSISIAPEVDNARVASINCSNFSDIATLRTMLNTATNWETDNSVAFDQSDPICKFTDGLSVDEELFSDTTITVRPNPVGDYFTLTTTNSITIDKIEIYNITGQKLLTIKDYNADTPVDMTNISSGIYLSKIYSGDKTVVKRLIKR